MAMVGGHGALARDHILVGGVMASKWGWLMAMGLLKEPDVVWECQGV